MKAKNRSRKKEHSDRLQGSCAQKAPETLVPNTKVHLSKPAFRIAIIGGGAAGLAAAVAAGKTLRIVAKQPCETELCQTHSVTVDTDRAYSVAADVGSDQMHSVTTDTPWVDVAVFEADERVGRSILSTGNGRCNFSNANIDGTYYRNGSFVEQALGALASLHAEHGDKATTSAVDVDPVCEFFADCGLFWREEKDGRRYPATNKASTVLDVLRAAAFAQGVREVCGRAVVSVEGPHKQGGCFTLRFSDDTFERADAVVLACGGRAGLNMACGGRLAAEVVPRDYEFNAVPLRSVLGPLKTQTHAIKGLDGVRVRCAVELWRNDKAKTPAKEKSQNEMKVSTGLEDAPVIADQDAQKTSRKGVAKNSLSEKMVICLPGEDEDDLAQAQLSAREYARYLNCDVNNGPYCDKRGMLLAREQGELLFRTYGVSGIAVFNLSRFARPGDVIAIDFLPQVRPCDMAAFMDARCKRMGLGGLAGTCGDFLRGLLLSSLVQVVLAQADLTSDSMCDEQAIRKLSETLKQFPLEVIGIGDARQCQVVRGGLSLSAFDPTTMEARVCPGFFVTGEALDVDAPCGGFNLHWAWTSGILAGTAAAKSIAERKDCSE